MRNLVFFLFITLFSCSGNMSAQGQLTADQTEAMLKADTTVQLIDLRTPGELQRTGHIEGAVNINYNGPDFAAQIAKLDKSRPVLLYCAAGSRSGNAYRQMKSMGFEKLYDYSGGMNDWKAKGKKTVQ